MKLAKQIAEILYPKTTFITDCHDVSRRIAEKVIANKLGPIRDVLNAMVGPYGDAPKPGGLQDLLTTGDDICAAYEILGLLQEE